MYSYHITVDLRKKGAFEMTHKSVMPFLTGKKCPALHFCHCVSSAISIADVF